MKTETAKEIITNKLTLPKVFIGFVPGDKFKTPQEVDAAIEEELRKDD